LLPITYHRRRREHRRLTLLLNVLLTARVSFESRQHKSFWAEIPPAAPRWWDRYLPSRLRRPTAPTSRWLRQYFWAPLDAIVTDALSPPAPERLAEVESE